MFKLFTVRLLQEISVKKKLARVVLLGITLVMIAVMSLFNYALYQEQISGRVSKIKTFSDFVAFYSQPALLFDDSNTAMEQLKFFISTPEIENIHIYKNRPQTNQFQYFAHYNKPGVAALPSQPVERDQPNSVTLYETELSVLTAVKIKKEAIGYILIKAHTRDIEERLFNNILLSIGLICLAVLFTYLFLYKIRSRYYLSFHQAQSYLTALIKSTDFNEAPPKTFVTEINMINNQISELSARFQSITSRFKEEQIDFKSQIHMLESNLKARTLSLKQANQELINTLERMHQYQSQLVENEKMASLGQLVAGVAHEVNTPIGLAITSSSLIHDKLNELRLELDNKQLTSNTLSKFIDDGDTNIQLILKNLLRAAELISTFKQVAVDQASVKERTFNLYELIQDAIRTIRPLGVLHEHAVEINCPPNLVLHSKPEPLFQIFIQLFDNALKHGLDANSAGLIRIDIEFSNNHCQVLFSDNGEGVQEQIKNRIFDPFVTTKRGEGGSGLGLHLVYNLVTQALNGNIRLDTKVTEGCVVIFDFPLPQAQVNYG